MSSISKLTETFKHEDHFKTREQILKLRQEWLDTNTPSKKEKLHMELSKYVGFENDLNWKKTRPEHAWKVAH